MTLSRIGLDWKKLYACNRLFARPDEGLRFIRGRRYSARVSAFAAARGPAGETITVGLSRRSPRRPQSAPGFIVILLTLGASCGRRRCPLIRPSPSGRPCTSRLCALKCGRCISPELGSDPLWSCLSSTPSAGLRLGYKFI